MLAGAKVSIVDPAPGVTRDRVSTVAEIPSGRPDLPPKITEVIDTGGYGVYVAEGARFNDVGEDLASLTPQIEAQIAHAVASADLVLFVIDAQAGVTAADHDFAKLLREGSIRRGNAGDRRQRAGAVAVVANKVDDSAWEAHALEGAALGFGEPLMVSAASNYLRRTFSERVYDLLPAKAGHDDAHDALQGASPVMRVAIIGKRNAGKSTMVNALAGEERVIVSEIAGSTRDAVDVRFERDGKVFVAIDTAGVRKKKAMHDQVEWWALDRMQRALERADVVLFLLDAATEISAVDKQLSSEVQKAFKPCVLVVNKWDLAEGKAGPTGKAITTDSYRNYIDDELKGLGHCPIAFATAAKGADEGGVWDILGVAGELFEQAQVRVGTGELNRAFREFAQGLPASKLGRRLKVLYATQVETAPPTIVLVVNDPGLYSPQAERFLNNRIREALPFPEAPVRLIIRGRRKDEDVGPDPERAKRAADHAAAKEGAGAKRSHAPMVEGISAEEFEGMDLSEDAE